MNDIVVLTCSCVCCRRSRYLSPCVSPIIDQFLAAGRGPRVTPRSPVPRQISRRFGTKPLGVDDGIKVFEFVTSPWPQHGTPCILRKGLSKRGKFWKGPGNDLHISYQGGETTLRLCRTWCNFNTRFPSKMTSVKKHMSYFCFNSISI